MKSRQSQGSPELDSPSVSLKEVVIWMDVDNFKILNILQGWNREQTKNPCCQLIRATIIQLSALASTTQQWNKALGDIWHCIHPLKTDVAWASLQTTLIMPPLFNRNTSISLWHTVQRAHQRHSTWANSAPKDPMLFSHWLIIAPHVPYCSKDALAWNMDYSILFGESKTDTSICFSSNLKWVLKIYLWSSCNGRIQSLCKTACYNPGVFQTRSLSKESTHMKIILNGGQTQICWSIKGIRCKMKIAGCVKQVWMDDGINVSIWINSLL